MNVLENYFDTNVIPDYCSKENLSMVYDNYLYNLKTCQYQTKWITLEEIEEHHLNGWKCIGDKYLEDSEHDKNKLALDIYRNGTYFPIFVSRQKEKPYKLRDGAHRLYTMKMLIKQGLWEKNRKILVATDEKVDGYKAGQEFKFRIPMMVVDEFKENYAILYDELKTQSPMIYTDHNKYFAEYVTKRLGYLATVCIGLLLRNALFEYRSKNGDIIKPSPIINDYDAWLEWRGY